MKKLSKGTIQKIKAWVILSFISGLIGMIIGIFLFRVWWMGALTGFFVGFIIPSIAILVFLLLYMMCS